MVHANVTWRSKFEKGGMLERGNREKHRTPCWFQQEHFFYSFLFEDLLFFPGILHVCFLLCVFVVVYSRLYLLEWNSQARSPHCVWGIAWEANTSHNPPPKPAWGTLCWFQLLGRVNLLGERDQRCIHSQWDSASLLFYLVSPDNCIIHAILEADPGNTVCLNQPITVSATALILRPCHVCETQDVTTADPALRVPFTPPPTKKNRIYWEPKCFYCGWLHPAKTLKSSQLNFKAGYLPN